MGIVNTFLSVFGFGFGTLVGLVIGYCLFIYVLPTDVKDVEISPLDDKDSNILFRLLPEIPLWVKNPDFERTEWLNKFIETMWPYLNKAICQMVKNMAKPIIEEQIPKYKIESVEFEQLSLGTLPPTFHGMKTYVTHEKEVIMEPFIKWAANPDITIVVKAFGLKATAQIVDLQVFASPRITLKPLVPSFPCFANVYVSLMEKPHLDFGLKLLGADLMAIPGLYRIVQELIKDQAANMYLWPKHLEIPIMDPSKVMRGPVGVLNVKVVKAIKLKKKDLFGTSDPYVKLKLTDDEKINAKQTTVRHNNLNPEWNEEFSLVVRDPQTQNLKITIYDWEQFGKHDKLGKNMVRLKELKADEQKTMTFDLLKNLDDPPNEKHRGQVVVELEYKTFTEEQRVNDLELESGMVDKIPEGPQSGEGVLIVIVHEAEDVEGKYHTNPYVRLNFKGEERRTKRLKRNRDPIWEEDFQFPLEEAPIDDKLHVEVVSTSSRSIMHQKETLGYVIISLDDVVYNRRINERYHLIDSKNGRIQIELQWRTAS